MKRRRLPRYGSTPAGLTAQRVTRIRTEPRPDAYYSRLYRITPQSVRAARVGDTWRKVATPPDVAPRAHRGNWGGL